MMSVPFFDMRGHLAATRGELDEAHKRVLDSGWTILGPEVERFESAFAEYCGVRECVGVANGLDALALTMRAYGIGRGDEVIVPAQTFVATWLAVTSVGAVPVAADIDPGSMNIDPEAVRAALTPRTVAILPVHLYGQSCDMDALREIATKARVLLLTDNAQAHGATWRGSVRGTIGDAASFSFYPTKNLGALGDGGAIVTDDASIAKKLRLLRNYGSVQKYWHEETGVNSRLDDLQAGFLGVKLKYLDSWNQRRREIAGVYSSHLSNLPGLTLPHMDPRTEHVFHLFVVRTSARDQLRTALEQRGIGVQMHYPTPPYLQPCYSDTPFVGKRLPVADLHADECLSLPIWPQMSVDEVNYVVESVREALIGR